jgi:homocysteine S-methyltransferase
VPNPFLERLERGPLVADGAIGTSLHERGVVWGRSLDEVTLTNRPLVLQLHLDYLLAGAELITSNTFGANRIRLAEFGLDERVRELNMFAVKTAREAREISGRQAFVAGAVGPVGRPGGGPRHREAELSAAFAEQVAGLLEGGADVIMLETFSDIIELELAVDACRATCDLPVLASMTFDAQHRTAGDLKPEAIAERLLELEVDIAGINCSTGPQSALDVLERLRAAGLDKVAVMPNAGLASRRGTEFLYRSTPTYFAEYARRFVEAGAAIVGGCCGTSPRHTAAMALALEEHTQRPPAPQSVLSFQGEPSVEERVVLRQEPTRLAQALEAGEFVVSVELAPPKGINPEKVIAGAQLLAGKGLRFANITDSAMARVRMGATAVAKLVQEHTQLESIIHYTTRDRNLMAIQSELIGAHALGVRNVLALTGDPPSVGEYPDATGVWDVESMGLVEVVNQMNEGNDARGRDIGPPAGFCVGCAVNPTAVDLELELERFEQKLAAGAHFIMSQPLYDMETLTSFLERVGDLPVPFLLGILPLQSARHAEYMHNEVPGIEVPQTLRDAMAAAGADGIPTGIQQAQEFIAEAQSLVDGIYLMPSFGRYEMCGDVLDALSSDRHPGTTPVVEPA